MDLEIKKLYYQQAVEIWQHFCELHRSLYDITCDEYLALLSGEVSTLETKLKEKEEIVELVGLAEADRKELITQINHYLDPNNQIIKASQLLEFMDDLDSKMDLPVLKKLNLLLIDMVEKIQAQNKKNQIFLNKAMYSLSELKEGFKGKKQYVTYGADGMASKSMSR